MGLSDLLFPYLTAPRRIAADVCDALRACDGLLALAPDPAIEALTADQYHGTVIRLCAASSQDATAMITALDRWLPVKVTLPLLDVPAPSSRFWFHGESVLHDVTLRFDLDAPPAQVPDAHAALATAIDRALGAVKEYLRDTGEYAAVGEAMRALDRAALVPGVLRRDGRGHVSELVQDCRDLHMALMLEVGRYG